MQSSLPGIEPPQSTKKAEPTERHRLRDIAATAPMRMLTDLPGVEGIVASGQFKTQHETGTSRGSYMPRYRAEWEDKVFSPGARPTYGYFSHGDESDMYRNRWLSDSREDFVGSYGNTAFEFGEHMRKHTTYTWGDSLGAKPEEITQQGEMRSGNLSAKYPGQEPITSADHFFTEMQMHKRAHLDDITQAIVYETHDPNNLPGVADKQTERTAKTQAVLMGGDVPHEVRRVGPGGQMVLPLEHEDWGSAHWKRVGDEETGRRVFAKHDTPEASWLRPGEESANFAYDTPADEQRPMVTTKSTWRPNRARS